MYRFDIKEGETFKCPTCGIVIAIENEEEILYKKVNLIYFKKGAQKVKAICARCKGLIEK